MADTPEPKLSLTDWIVLALIDEEPRHGFSAARELEAGGPLGRVWTVPRPLVYRAFEHLEAASLIERVATEPGDKGPVRTVFRATPTGRKAVATWLEEPVAHPRDVRTELVAKFVLIARRHHSEAVLVARQQERFAPVAAGLEAKAARADGADRAVALWRFEQMRAIQRLLEAMQVDATRR